MTSKLSLNESDWQRVFCYEALSLYLISVYTFTDILTSTLLDCSVNIISCIQIFSYYMLLIFCLHHCSWKCVFCQGPSPSQKPFLIYLFFLTEYNCHVSHDAETSTRETERHTRRVRELTFIMLVGPEELTLQALSPKQRGYRIFIHGQAWLSWFSGLRGLGDCKEQDKGEWDKLQFLVLWVPTFWDWSDPDFARSKLSYRGRRSRKSYKILTFPLLSPLLMLLSLIEEIIISCFVGHSELPVV